MDRKIIFLDIDGTLTEPGCNEPPESALRAVRSAQKQGHLVFLCTGRNYDMLKPLLKYGFDGVIASSGGYVVCREDLGGENACRGQGAERESVRAAPEGRVIYDCPMTEEQKNRAMDILAKNGVYRTIECMDGSYTDEGFKEFLQEHASEGSNSELLRWRRQIEKSLNILPMAQYRGQPAYKIVVMSPDPERLKEPLALLGKEFSICIQDRDKHGFVNGEIIRRDFDKGQAVKRVCTCLGIPLEDTVAFGDSMNDLEMLETAGLSICMGNGSEELKKLADEVCPTVKEGGIHYAFRKHHLIPA